ncbi:MAG: hypothetical protein WAU56_07410 [Steroidobacteraceae bacterium]
MPDVTTIAAALTSFDALKNIAKAMMSLHDTQAFQLKVIEFNEAIIDAQTKIFSVNEERAALIERVRELEESVTNLEAWEAEKQRYELKSVARDSFAYVLKAEAQGAEPTHKICANCYQHRKKAILQLEPRSAVHIDVGVPQTYICPECRTKIIA